MIFFDWVCPRCGGRFAEPDALPDPGVCPDCDAPRREHLLQHEPADQLKGKSLSTHTWRPNAFDPFAIEQLP